MIKSMTGFGREEFSTEMGFFSVEVKSVNSRTCTVIVKLPEHFIFLDSQVSSYIRSRASRGQINVSVTLDRNGAPSGRTVTIDRELAREYCEQLAEVKEYLSLAEPISLDTVTALPGVINIDEPRQNTDEIWQVLHRVLEIAVDRFIEMRETEGMAISQDLAHRLETMSQLTDQISTRAPEMVENYRQRLRKRVGELLRDQVVIDESRIAMEVALMAERCDITEEIVRLRSHIDQIRDSLNNSDGPVGRHLDFILQEINREVNTIASKSSDRQISTDCIQFKDETGKMREQVQNIE